MRKNNYNSKAVFNMKYVATVFLFLVFLSRSAIAGPDTSPVVPGDDDPRKLKREMTEEELEKSIGRMGEVEPIPEDFEFNEAEKKLWLDDHLANIEKPVRLYYEFEKSGSYEEGFSDSIYLNIMEINEDGSKNADLDFFTAERKQEISPQNVTNIRGNPILAVYMQGDIYEMNRLTDGHWRYFQKRIKMAMRNKAVVEPVTFRFKGEEVKGEKIVFSPYLDDPHRSDFEKFADKRYEFILSDEIPGKLYQIKTVIPDKSAQEPLIEEKLQLVEVNFKG